MADQSSQSPDQAPPATPAQRMYTPPSEWRYMTPVMPWTKTKEQKEADIAKMKESRAQITAPPPMREFIFPEFVMPSAETKKADIARMKESKVHITNWPDVENKRPHAKMMPFLIPTPDPGVRRRVLNSNDHDGMVIYPVEYEIDLEATWFRMVMTAKTIADSPARTAMVACDEDGGMSEAVTDFKAHTQVILYSDGSYNLDGVKLLVITYPTRSDDHRRLMKDAYNAGIRTIAFCPYDCPMEYVHDVNTTIIPAGVGRSCSDEAVPCIFDILTRMVLQARGQMKQGPGWYKIKFNLMDPDQPHILHPYTRPREVDDDDDDTDDDDGPLSEGDWSYKECEDYFWSVYEERVKQGICRKVCREV